MAYIDQAPTTGEYKVLTTTSVPFRRSPTSHRKSWTLSCSLSNCQRETRKKVYWTTEINSNLPGGIRKSETSKIRKVQGFETICRYSRYNYH